MYQLPDNNTDINGNPIRTVPNREAGPGMNGEYEPFGQQSAFSTIGGGGGGYVPPVQPNPTFVPPTFAQDNVIKIIVGAFEEVQFTENDINIGVGKSVTLDKTFLTFGSEKIYRANKSGLRAKNYFTVSIQKKFNTIRDLQLNQNNLVPGLPSISDDSTNVLPTLLSRALNADDTTTTIQSNLTFGYNVGNPITINDYLYAETISVKEYEYNSDTNSYTFSSEKIVEKSLGVVNLEFTFIDEIVSEENQTIDYQIKFISNYASDLENILSLNYSIVSPSGLVIDTETISLSDGGTDGKSVDTYTLKDSEIRVKIIGQLPIGYRVKKIYYGVDTTLIKNPSLIHWKEVGLEFSIPGNELRNDIVVNAEIEKDIVTPKPQLTLSSTQYDKEVKDSDKDTIINIPFNYSNAGFVKVYTSDKDYFRTNVGKGFIQLSFAKNFNKVYGKKKIVLVPFSSEYGDGDRYEVLVNFIAVNDFPSITQIIFPTEVEVPSFADGNVEWDVTYNTKAVSTIDVDVYLKDKSRVSLFKNLPQKGGFKINLRDLATKFPQWNGSSELTLILKPYNRSGETELIGNDYEVTTNIIYPSIKLDEDIIRKSLYDAFSENLKFIEPEKDSKYLTHLINLENDERVIISSWEEDNWTLSEKTEDELGNQVVKKEVKSIILKLYEPLPPQIQVNSTMWITKLMSNPLIETIVLNEEVKEEYPLIKGPNFDIEVDFVRGQATNYESLDDLIISASSSTTLIQNYLSASLVDTTDLNVQYVPVYSNIPDSPSGFVNASIVYSVYKAPYYTATGVANHNYRIYSYRETDSGKIFSNNYITLQSVIQSNNSGNDYRILVSWNRVENVDGYLVLKLYADSYNYDYGYYTTDTSFTDTDESLFTPLTLPAVNEFNGNYLWENFVHFSSAEERIKNFVYKVQLIENYEQLILSASTDYTSGGNAAWTASLASQQEVQRLNAKKSSLIQGFDGFETFLFTSSSKYTSEYSSSATWPYSGTDRLSSTDTQVIGWYENIIDYATYYDNNNPNWLVNNIPQYITTNPENDQFLLFFSMIGHHFDNIYFYTKALERSRGFGYNSKNGLANKLLFDSLKSFGWDAKNLGGDKELWNYVFGQDKAGGSKESTPSNERSKEVWRRIINNLPYLLKHKGTRRGIYALMACYGIPSSNLSIMEFGGPEVTDDTKNKLMLDGTSYGLSMVSGNSISIGSVSNAKTIELFVKPAKAGNYNVVSDGTTNIIISGSVGSEYGKVKFGAIETPLLPLFNGRYFGICLSNDTSNRRLDVMQVESDRLIFSASVTGATALATTFTIGSTFSGSIDEFRIWNTPLSSSVFQQHVYYPEMINGNHISASTTDLELRFDFEYPKNLNTKTKILNVAPGIKLNVSSSRNYYEDNGVTTGLSRLRTTMPFNATAASFTSVVNHPYQFEVINRNFVLEMPDIGTSRYATNKVRFEEQTLISDLSPKYRSTKKAFDNQPIDSNRVGLFFSPNKELNLDIAKSLGDVNLNEYIANPSDRFKPGYKSLDLIRNYYFQKIQKRDIYAYINLIRAYEKTMFEDIKKMLPARVTATTGILIEPHFLERSKYQYTKPTGSSDYYEGINEYSSDINSEYTQYETIVDANLGEELFGENNQYESSIDADLSEKLFAENEQYETIIHANDEINTSGENFNYETLINSKLNEPTITSQDINDDYNKLISTNDYQDVGFSIYCQNGAALYSHYDNGVLVKERVRVTLVKEVKTKVFEKYNVVINGVGDPRGGFIQTSSLYTETNLIIQPYSGSIMPMSGSGSIVSATVVSGYLPTHYRFTTDLTLGMQNSYYKGSKNTSATTLDGTEPIEVFVTNPNTIKVVGRDNNEPILDVE